MVCLPYSLSASANHSHAVLRTDINAETTTVTSIAVYDQLSVVQFPCSEVTNLYTFSAIGAFIYFGRFDTISLVASDLIWAGKIFAAVVTAEAYSIGLSPIFFVSKRSGYQMLVFCFKKNLLDLSKRDFPSTRPSATWNIIPEH
jgi:hypothetical protein